MSPILGRRLALAGALAAGIGAIGFVTFGNLGKNLVYYWSPSELVDHGDAAHDATVRLGGLVVADSIDWQPDAQGLAFQITDGKATVPVHVTGAPPQMFRAGIGVLVEGHLAQSGVFESDRLMVKHSNEYRAPTEGESTAELYQTVDLETLDAKPLKP